MTSSVALTLGGIVRSMLVPEQQAALMARVAEQGDRAAFSDLLHHFAPRVKGFLLGKGADASQVDEVVQEVMLTVWARAARYDAARAGVSTWVFTIARNRWIDRIRKERRPTVEANDPAWVPSAPEAPDEALSTQRDQQKVAQAMAALPEAQRSIIRRAYFMGHSQRVIAEDLGVPIGTVKSRVRLALGHLRTLLDEPDPLGARP